MTGAQKELARVLSRRWLTSLDAALLHGVWALSQRCGELQRAGVCVDKRWKKLSTGKRVMEYRVTNPTRWTA